MPQQGGDVLADVVAACAGLEEVHRVFLRSSPGLEVILARSSGIKFHGVIVPGSHCALLDPRTRHAWPPVAAVAPSPRVAAGWPSPE